MLVAVHVQTIVDICTKSRIFTDTHRGFKQMPPIHAYIDTSLRIHTNTHACLMIFNNTNTNTGNFSHNTNMDVW